MGKIYKASHGVKAMAGKMADGYAMRHRGVVCITPSEKYKKQCTFDANTGLWTCWAAAHEQRGSCDRNDVLVGQGPDGPTVTDGPGPNDWKGMVQEVYEEALPEDYIEQEAGLL